MLAGNNTLYKDFSMSETILPEVFASPMPVAAPGLLDEIMAQTRFKPESESYDNLPDTERTVTGTDFSGMFIVGVHW